VALRAIKGDEDAVAAGRRFRRFFAGSSTECPMARGGPPKVNQPKNGS
jgi:hypothetical protein